MGAAVAGNAVTLKFTAGLIEFGSLADGRYTLTVLAALFNRGQFDGDGDTDAGDFSVFRLAFGGSEPACEAQPLATRLLSNQDIMKN